MLRTMQALIVTITVLFSFSVFAGEMIEIAPAQPAKTAIVVAVDTPGSENVAALNIMIGLVPAVRAEFLTRLDGGSFVGLEAFFGGGGTQVGLATMVGGGLRLKIPVLSDHQNDVLFVSPGLDVFVVMKGQYTEDNAWYGGPYSNVYFLAANVDISWLHEISKHFGFELGLQVGAGIAFAGQDGFNRVAAGEIQPQVSLFTGFRF
jgi:hypothetical protein